VESSPESTETAPSLLLSWSIGLGSLALVLAVVAVVLLLKNQGTFTHAKYRSNRETFSVDADSTEP
jgi:hypothetical protein